MNPQTSRRRRLDRLHEQAAVQTKISKPIPAELRPNQPLLRPPAKLPDPWLFDSEKLLRELNRCRETVLQIPVNGDLHATHFGINNAISAIWNLREQLRYLLSLHREGQRAFAQQAESPKKKVTISR